MAKRNTELNNQQLIHPVVDDIWHEMVHPVYRTVEVIRENGTITGLVTITPTWLKEGTYIWCEIETNNPAFNVSKHGERKNWTLEEFRTHVSYGNIPGTWCDVYPTWLKSVKTILREEK